MSDLFPSFFAGRKSPAPPAAPAATAARELRHDDLQRMQQVQQPAMAEIGYGGLPCAADAASAAGRERSNQPHPEAAPTLAHQISWQVRAASLEHDDGLPYEWCEPFAKLLCGGPPRGFDHAYWLRVLPGATAFADEWAAYAHALGWAAEEAFGLDKLKPAARHDRKGLAWLLSDNARVLALDERGADIVTQQGSKQRFYRSIKAEGG